MDPLAGAIAAVALSAAAAGVGLLVRRSAMISGAAGVATGVVLLVAVAADRMGSVHTQALLSLALAVLGVSALTAYPRLQWQHPLDALAQMTLPAAGVLATWCFAVGRADVGALVLFLQGCLFIAVTWWRLETAEDGERRALTWSSLALVVTGLLFFFALFASDQADSNVLPSVAVACFVAVPPAMYVGATLPDVVDVRALVVSAVVTAAALIMVMSVYALGIGLLAALGAGELSVGTQGLVAAAAAVCFQPTRVALRGVVDQLLFGERPDPMGAASALASRIGDDPLPAVQAIREALVVPYAALVVDGVPVASSGTATAHVRHVALADDAHLVVGLRPGDLSLTAGDRHVLAVVAPLLRLTLRAQRLTAEVQESRGRAVAALEEERRRLRRDLHDGLGPTLSGLAYTADAARNTLRDAPDDADELLRTLRADAVTAVGEVRRLVYGMRPPALDELGLARALVQWSSGLHTASGSALAVAVDAADLPPLPAGVETAAYRIAVEALTNAARHSGATEASLCLRLGDGVLVVEVADRGPEGAAEPPDWTPGVGISSMRERAAEVGGTLQTGRGRVRAELPL